MCLAIRYDRRFTGRKGWKLLYSGVGGLTTGMCATRPIVLSNKKFTRASREPVTTLMANSDIYYPCGFHIFTRKADAIRVQKHFPSTRVCQVEFRRQVAYGEVGWSFVSFLDTTRTPTVVARECKIAQVHPRRR